MKTFASYLPSGHLADFLAKPLLGVLDVVVDGSLDDLGPPLADHRLEQLHAVLHGADHGREVAREGREAIIALHQLDDVAPLLAAMNQLEARDRQALR